jgi:type I restriction enzyme S subunit
MISPKFFRKDVPHKKLGDLVVFLDHLRKPITASDRVAGLIPYYGANGIQGYVKDFLFDEDLVLLAEDGGHFEDADRGVAYKVSGKTWVNNHAHVLRPTKNINVDYLFRVLQNLDLTAYINGTTRAKLTKANAASIEIPIPPFAEQQRIAALLDTAEHILKQRESAIAKLDQLAQSVFVDMFGSQTWEVHKLSAICDLQNGYAFKSDDYVDESDVLNCRMSNIRPNGDFDIFYNARYLSSNFSEKYKEFLLKDGDVIIAMTDMAGEPKILGVPTIVDTKGKKLLLNQRVGKLVFKKQNTLNIDYLKFALTQRSIKNYFKKFANGGVQINLGKADLLSVPIAIPNYEQQIIFSQKIQKIFKLKHVENFELDKLKKLQSSLQHQSFAVN